MTRFYIEENLYDDSSLTFIGGGSYGDVYSLDADNVAKVLFDKPPQEHALKITQLTSLGQSFLALPSGLSNTAAMPIGVATIAETGETIGYSMRRVGAPTPLFSLYYDANNQIYKSSSGVKLNDQSALRLIISLFSGLSALSQLGITLGDVAPQNILVNIETLKPCFIDIDDAAIEDHLSSSQGTEGYVDPRLLQMDVNEIGGLPFDTSSDIYSVTVIAFRLLFGISPHIIPLKPVPPDHSILTINRMTNYRLFREGNFTSVDKLGYKVADFAIFQYLATRYSDLQTIAGDTGKDGEIVLRHFDAVFVDDQRDSLLNLLPSSDMRSTENSPRYNVANTREEAILQKWGYEDIRRTLSALGAHKRRTDKKTRVRLLSGDAATYDGDPPILTSFLAERHLSIGALLMQG